MTKTQGLVPTRFINAEPNVLPVGDGIPVIVLSFGAEEGPVEDRAIQLDEARQIVVDVVASLAQMGDALAQEIGERYFSDESSEEYEAQEEDYGAAPDDDGNQN